MSYLVDELKRGILTENPILVLALGLCPALGVSTSVANAIAMGIAVTFVLIASNGVVSLIKGLIPTQVRIPSYIVIIATTQASGIRELATRHQREVTQFTGSLQQDTSNKKR